MAKNEDKDTNDYGVVSAAVGAERAERIKRSAKDRARSVSFVVNEIMQLSEDVYFKKYPPPGASQRRRRSPAGANA